jgi:outer membrane protein assembly factor BamB
MVATGATAAALALGAFVLLFPRPGRGGTLVSRAARVIVFATLVAGLKIEYDRWPRKTVVPNGLQENPLTDAWLRGLPPDFQLQWALRVAAQAISAHGSVDSVVDIPAEWPLPPNTRLVVSGRDDAIVLTALDSGETRACRFMIFLRYSQAEPLPDRHDPIRCDRASASTQSDARSLAVRRVARFAAGNNSRAATALRDDWPEYRRAADRDGTELFSDGRLIPKWRAIVDGEVRATPSVTEGKVLIGTHGAGALHAFDLRTGRLLWMRYVPNWIHQDAVSDGRTVLVGFADTENSQYGWTPAGVSAFSLETGALLWSAFEGNAVMTSPVIWRERAVYITSAGILKIRNLQTGAETARLRLPGRTMMASPTLRGDTLVASLDNAEDVCAVRLDQLTILWCTPLPRGGMGGTSAPTVVGGRVYATAAILQPDNGPLGLSADSWHLVKYMLGWMRSSDWTFTAQRLWALDLATGNIVWQSPSYPAVRNPGGNISGTAIVDGANAVVVLPLAGKMVALDLESGKERWAHETGLSRGPVAYGGSQLWLTLRDGHLQSVNAETGITDCSISTRAGFDRDGPAVADSTLYFGSVGGVMYAMPISMLAGCQEPAVKALVH